MRHTILIASLLATLCCAQPAQAVTQYSLTDLGTLVGPIGDSFPRALNASGQVVGFSSNTAFLYSGGTMTNLGTLSGTQTGSAALGINAAGQVVGYSAANPFLESRAFLYSDGTMTNIDNWVGSHASSASGINSSGQIVGQYYIDGGVQRPFVYSAGTMTDIGTLGGSSAGASGINDAGQIAGSATTADDAATHAFRYEAGVMTDLGTLGGNDSHATAINANGDVVGYSAEDGADYRAFLYSGGVMTDLGGWGFSNNSDAEGINNLGQIVGSDGLSAFLYTDGTAYNLNSLLDAIVRVGMLDIAWGINDSGQIVAGAIHLAWISRRAANPGARTVQCVARRRWLSRLGRLSMAATEALANPTDAALSRRLYGTVRYRTNPSVFRDSEKTTLFLGLVCAPGTQPFDDTGSWSGGAAEFVPAVASLNEPYLTIKVHSNLQVRITRRPPTQILPILEIGAIVRAVLKDAVNHPALRRLFHY